MANDVKVRRCSLTECTALKVRKTQKQIVKPSELQEQKIKFDHSFLRIIDGLNIAFEFSRPLMISDLFNIPHLQISSWVQAKSYTRDSSFDPTL